MRLLVLGGTVFLSRAIAREALARGHDVTCAARGESGEVPTGARLVHLDRTDPDWSGLTGEWDALVDVARTPSWVAGALDALADRVAHWTFVSSISVYADHTVPGRGPDDSDLLEAITADVEQDSAEAYGASKVGCEQLVQARAQHALVVRPGLIVGPEDPTGRFTYWPERLATAGPVLAPGDPDQPTQVIDARDLAAFVVHAAEERLSGAYDATGHAVPMRELLASVAQGVGSETDLVWTDAGFLGAHDVGHWAGPRSLPLWLPPEMTGMLARDVEATYAAGLETRPLEETARDTLAWLAEHPDAPRTGLTRTEEHAVLADAGRPGDTSD